MDTEPSIATFQEMNNIMYLETIRRALGYGWFAGVPGKRRPPEYFGMLPDTVANEVVRAILG